MPSRRVSDLEKETTIERIFRKVVGRKMTAFEKVSLHLKRRMKPPPRDGTSNSRAAKANRKKISRS
jgi:hypothetical protein